MADNRLIYLDNAATTKMAPEVLEAMLPYFGEYYGNPSTIYSLGSASKRAVSEAREAIAKTLGAANSEIYFTASGSESDNWAIKGIAQAYADKGRHIITTRIEHHAVLHTCEYLEGRGYEVTYLDVDAGGLVDPKELERAIRPDTILISIMYANNEIGTIQPIAELAAIARAHGILFHTDAVQAYGHLPIQVQELGIDLLSASGHKFHGPKGVGFLYVRRNLRLPSLIHGGGQERGRRAGTENVPAIVGMGAAAVKAADTLSERAAREEQLRDDLIRLLKERVPCCALNGDPSRRLPNNVNFRFSCVEGESLLILLDRLGICASSGSACSTLSLDPSHVLRAIGLDADEARSSVRFTLSEETTREDLERVVAAVSESVKKLRSFSVDWEKKHGLEDAAHRG